MSAVDDIASEHLMDPGEVVDAMEELYLDANAPVRGTRGCHPGV